MENSRFIVQGQLKDLLVNSMLDSIHEAILVVDTATKIVFVNESYCRLFHVPKDRIVGRLLENIKPDAAVIEAMRTRQPVLGRFIRVETSSGRIWVVSNSKPLLDKGTLWGAVAVIRDVTEAMEMTNALRHLCNLAQDIEEPSRESIDLISDEIVGTHPTLIRTLGIAGKVSKTDINVLITGETGTGKELLARAIHMNSARSRDPFVTLNCASIPESLFESELFGYEPGAFSGASTHGKPGKFELANKGTLFLDEIGELPLNLQAKMLRVIEAREVDKIGGKKPIKINTRILCATNRDLESGIRENTFRRDLYHRVATITINMPPLRNRGGDILLIANRCIAQIREQTGKQYVLSADACDAMQDYHWPGNARQLHNVIARACAMSTGGIIRPADLSLEKTAGTQPPNQRLPQWSAPDESSTNPVDLDLGFKELIAKQERLIIEKALAASNGNKTKALSMLKMNRKCFYDKLKKYGIGSKLSS